VVSEEFAMPDVLDWLGSPAFTAFGAPTSNAELLGFVTGVLCVWLVARQRVLNWPVGIASCLFFILLFTDAGLYGDASLQVVFILLGLWGWARWLAGRRSTEKMPVSRSSHQEWLGYAVALVVGAAVMWAFLDQFTSSTVPLADGLTTTLSLIATYGQIKKRVECWYFWIAADLVYIPLYQHKGLTLTALLYIGFACLCVYGLLDWRRSERTERSVEVLPLTTAAQGMA
jgi:nicotinamide mononucleotide transporter